MNQVGVVERNLLVSGTIVDRHRSPRGHRDHWKNLCLSSLEGLKLHLMTFLRLVNLEEDRDLSSIDLGCGGCSAIHEEEGKM